ncbi:MAG: type II secretion system F family protein [Actinomycetaceae bacterium]|nr:type II secretion system F family protein [Actinomycetaceae bacterium]
MSLVVGLLAGCAVGFLWWAMAFPIRVRPTRQQGPLPSRGRAVLAAKLRDLCVQAGHPSLRAHTFVLVSLGIAILAGGLTFLVSSHMLLALIVSFIASAAPTLFLVSAAAQRRKTMRETWPEVIEHIISGVRAGMSLGETLSTLAETGPACIRGDMRSFVGEYSATGRFDSALKQAKASFADPVADRVFEAIRLADAAGGVHLVSLLEDLAFMLREEQRTRREVEARQSWTITGARLAAAAPWAVLGLLMMREDAATLYATSTGSTVMAIGVVVTALAYGMMLRLGRLPDSPRTLR